MSPASERSQAVNQAILEYLKTRTLPEPAKFHEIDGAVMKLPFVTDWNVTNHALQRLRKQGRVKYIKGEGAGWVLA